MSSDMPMDVRATLRDVASAAGVTASTVSRVLNHKELTISVSEDTRRRIIEAADTLNYTPHRLARGLATSKTYVLGLCFTISRPAEQIVYREVTWANIGAFLAGIHTVTQREGYETHIFHRMEAHFKHPHPPQEVSPECIDALVYVNPNPIYDHYSKLIRNRFPLVFTGPCPVGLNHYSVSLDDQGGTRQVVEALARMGHKRIGYFLCTPSEPPLDCRLRLAGYHEALQKYGLPDVKRLVAEMEDPEIPVPEIARMLLSGNGAPDAVIIGRPELVPDFMKGMRAAGRRCPSDLTLLTVGDDHSFNTMHPSMTALRIPYVELGIEAATMALGIAEGKITELRHVRLMWNIVERESCVFGGSLTEAESLVEQEALFACNTTP